jgi:glycogen(starch) synthase
MAGAELLVVPSRLEPFGIVILEAWRAGTAVLATDRGGPAELIEDGEDGVVVDPFDADRFARTLGSLLDDDRRRTSLARAGRARVGAFGWPQVAERYREIYAEIGAGTPIGASERADGGVHHAHQGESIR